MFPLLRETNLRLLLSPLPTPPRLASSLLFLSLSLSLSLPPSLSLSLSPIGHPHSALLLRCTVAPTLLFVHTDFICSFLCAR